MFTKAEIVSVIGEPQARPIGLIFQPSKYLWRICGVDDDRATKSMGDSGDL